MARKRRGICPVCRRNVAVTWETGRVFLHGPNSNRCAGTGQEPEELT